MSNVISDVCEVLRRVSKWRWRTTEALARELELEPHMLFRVLEEHANQEGRRLRYNRYPSRRLNVLWGLVDCVGEDPHLPPLRRADQPDATRPERLHNGSPLVFVSHCHRDAEAAAAVAKLLQQSGGQPWLFETEIEEDAPIIAAVYESIENCEGVVVFVSRAALGSLWVQKEFGKTLDELRCPVLVLLDDDDAGMVEAVESRNIDQVAKCVRQHTDSEDKVGHARYFAADLFKYGKWVLKSNHDAICSWAKTLLR